MIREKDDTFTLSFEKPIYPRAYTDESAAIEDLINGYLPSIESAIKTYPGQWFVFRYFWEAKDEKNRRPDTVV